MSHIESVTPSETVTLPPGGEQVFRVAVSGVPGDDSFTFQAIGSDGFPVPVSIVVDRAALEGIASGNPAPHQVIGLADGGTVEVLGSFEPGTVDFAYTAPE